MSVEKLLIANRGEIAIRIARAANELDIATVAIHSEDDGSSLHTRATNESIELNNRGVAAYLDIDAIVQAATDTGTELLHPGYGFLSENAGLASACLKAGINFIGPTSEQLAIFGNKAGARELAAELHVPLVPGTNNDTSLDQVLDFWDQHPEQGIIIKAVSGGGGRGMRIIESRDDIEKQYERCRSEANMAFGDDAVYVESLISSARHIEVQVIGDGTGNVVHLWERDCSAQRQNQKIIEIAPSPNLPALTRDALLEASVRLAVARDYRGLGTFEFLVDANNPAQYYFIEANARLQVEHTVTEAITGLDLVALQLGVADGRSLSELGLDHPVPCQGFAVQARINMETPGKKGLFKPTGGTLTVFEPPSGPGIRTDSFQFIPEAGTMILDPRMGQFMQ